MINTPYISELILKKRIDEVKESMNQSSDKGMLTDGQEIYPDRGGLELCNATFDSYPLSELASELEAVRQSTLFLFKHMDEQAWTRRGVANNNEVSVRALAYIIAGHELHHREVLQTRYL